MTHKHQVVSLELARRLKQLKVRQESLFYWRLAYSTSESFDKGVSLGKKGEFGDYRIEYYPKPRYRTADIKWNEADLSKLDETEVSAYTVTELGEMFLTGCKGTLKFKTYRATDGEFWITLSYTENDQLNESLMFSGNTEADARAKMLIYLLENKLITLWHNKK